MKKQELHMIDPYEFTVQIHDLWKNQWLLLTSGNFEKEDYNTMTVAWGSLGVMWNKPFAMVVVRPSRYTFEFINQYPDFTLTAFPKEFHKDLSYLGKVSGRDENKILKTALHTCKSEKVDAPCFTEAELIIECRKTYWNDFHPDHFLDKSIRNHHENTNIHRMYFGEIVSVQATEKYSNNI